MLLRILKIGAFLMNRIRSPDCLNFFWNSISGSPLTFLFCQKKVFRWPRHGYKAVKGFSQIFWSFKACTAQCFAA